MGDFMRMNEDGDLEFMERTADTIKYKAYRISASEIEAVLQDHPTVIGACCVGIPDPRVGERIKAIVVLKEDARGVEKHRADEVVQGPLAVIRAPRHKIREMSPKSKVGKLLRRRNQGRREKKAEKGARETRKVRLQLNDYPECP